MENSYSSGAARARAPYESIPTKPPLACIEVLSREDRMTSLLEKVEDYRRFGVPNIWLIDPATRNGFEWRSGGLFRTSIFTATTGPIRLDLEQLFNDLD
jgi:Uma2 family endonuclease